VAGITTSDLFSIETVNTLVVDPLYQTSAVLRSGLQRFATGASRVYLPVVSGGSAEWREELEDLGDAAVDAEELEVVPRKVGDGAFVSTYPEPRDIFIDVEWRMAEDGSFTERIENSLGLFVPLSGKERVAWLWHRG